MRLIWGLIFGFTLQFAGQASANIIVTDINLGDLNTIDSVVVNPANVPPDVIIKETYGEDNLIPFPSHDGNAVVDNDPSEGVRYFDKGVELTAGEAGKWDFVFEITNDTPYRWSDYHFLFYTDDTFMTELDVESTDILFGWSNTVQFQNTDLSGNELQFWSPAHHEIGATHTYQLALDLDALRAATGNDFGIRQVATTPIPGTVALMGFGLAAGFVARRRRSAQVATTVTV